MKTLSPDEYDRLRDAAVVVAADLHGDKVLKLADGTYLKLFRIKRLLTSARFFPYWRRFVRNAGRLAELGVPTLRVIEVIDLPHLDRTAVHYDPLPGHNLREVSELDEPLVRQLGEFIAALHEQGAYLRSLHLGNVVRTPDGELGLIDIADMTISGRPLRAGKRLRNYRHLARYGEDRPRVAAHLKSFTQGLAEPLKQQVRDLFK